MLANFAVTYGNSYGLVKVKTLTSLTLLTLDILKASFRLFSLNRKVVHRHQAVPQPVPAGLQSSSSSELRWWHKGQVPQEPRWCTPSNCSIRNHQPY